MGEIWIDIRKSDFGTYEVAMEPPVTQHTHMLLWWVRIRRYIGVSGLRDVLGEIWIDIGKSGFGIYEVAMDPPVTRDTHSRPSSAPVGLNFCYRKQFDP